MGEKWQGQYVTLFLSEQKQAGCLAKTDVLFSHGMLCQRLAEDDNKLQRQRQRQLTWLNMAVLTRWEWEMKRFRFKQNTVSRELKEYTERKNGRDRLREMGEYESRI